VPRNSSRRRIGEAHLHRADLPPRDIVRVDGQRVTSPARTVLDLTRTLPLPEGVAVVDSSLRRGAVPLRELQRRAATARGPGSSRLIRAVALADPRCESFLESYCRALLHAAGLGPPSTQYVVKDGAGRRLARVDFAWPGCWVIVEVDGFEFHADRSSYRSDRRRINALELAGWLVLRFSWEDVVGNAPYVVACVAAALGVAARVA
jgi:hypothetical protein